MAGRAPRKSISFLLNDQFVECSHVDPHETLLGFLRTSKRLTGTKEGCAEGDCGACTVLVGRLVDGTITYESVNACIRFLGSLDGSHVVTIEHLGSAEKLHPVQQAMVNFDGSQCGFCTPGFVMSLYAHWLKTPATSDKATEAALQGNLCRCTGYESIMRAARALSANDNVAEDPLVRNRDAVASQLRALADHSRVDIGHGRDRLIIPASSDDLASILEENPSATIVAGSTDVGLWVTKHMRDIAPVIFIGNLGDLKSIYDTGNEISIGASVTYAEAIETLSSRIVPLGALINRIGGQQIRNMGTIVGNIANGSPIGDFPPPLIALNARLTLRRGPERRNIPLETFFLEYNRQDRQPGEFIETVHIPVPDRLDIFAVYKISKRRDEDITAVLGAFYLRLDDDRKVTHIRFAFGGMAGIPKRAKAVEAALMNKPWTEASVQAAMPLLADDFTPLSDMRASAEYRMLVARNLLLRFYEETHDRRIQTDRPQ